MDFTGKRKIWFSVSLIIILTGLIMIPIRGGLNKDIEFTGGTMLHINIGQAFTDVEIKAVVEEVTGQETRNIVKVSGKDEVIIKTKSLDTDKRKEAFNAIAGKYNLEAEDFLNFSDISGTISGEMQKTAFLAVIVSALAMLIYITFRFRDYRFGVSAVAALIHDVFVVLAVYSIFNIPVNISFIAAMLTIVGYSINDTIVLFDRVRENQKFMKRGDYSGLVNRSIKQTLSRSINTSLTTFVMITGLYILGVPSIREFAFPLMVGILSGTYSSIFIASPIWYTFKKKDERKVAI